MVNNRGLQIGSDKRLQEIFSLGIGDEKTATERSETGSEMLDSLDLEACAPNATLSDTKLVLSLCIKPRVKAVHGYDLFVLALLLDCPVQNSIVMNAKIITHPKNHSVHLLWSKL